MSRAVPRSIAPGFWSFFTPRNIRTLSPSQKSIKQPHTIHCFLWRKKRRGFVHPRGPDPSLTQTIQTKVEILVPSRRPGPNHQLAVNADHISKASINGSGVEAGRREGIPHGVVFFFFFCFLRSIQSGLFFHARCAQLQSLQPEDVDSFRCILCLGLVRCRLEYVTE